MTGRDIQSRSLRGGRSPCATGRTKYGKDGADVKEFSQTIHHEVGGHEFVKLLGAILLFWKHSIMRFKTYLCAKVRLLIENKECLVLKVTENMYNIRNILHLCQSMKACDE